MGKPTKNQGEGDRVSAERYNRRTTTHARAGHVDQEAEAAKRALSGKEREELKRAEDLGRRRAKEEDPQVKRDR